MSDRVVIRCPGCDQTLGIKKETVGQQVKCPGCGATLRTKVSQRGKSSSGSGRSEQRSKTSSRKVRPAADEVEGESRSRRKQSRRTGSSSKASASAEGRASQKKLSSSKRKRKPAPVEEEFLDDGWDDSIDEFDEYGNAYSKDDAGAEEDWLDDEYSSSGGGQIDDWDSPASLPSAPRKRKKKTTKGKKKRSAGAKVAGVLAGGGVMVWGVAGLLAGVVSFALTIAAGLSGVWVLLLLSTIISGSMIGGAIRLAARDTDGWAPGLFAVAIAVPVIVVGRIGAFYVIPEMSAAFGSSEDKSPTEIREETDRETSNEGMIAQLIEAQLLYDNNWLDRAGVAEDDFYSAAYDEADWFEMDKIPYSERYDDTVWSEGKRRWDKIPVEIRDEQVETKRLDFLLNEGLLDDESFAQLLDHRTSDSAMTERLAYSVRSDTEWLDESRLIESSLMHYRERNYLKPTAKEREHPKVWTEASKRWLELSEEEQTAKKAKIEGELKLQMEFVKNGDESAKKTRLGLAIILGLGTLFLPFGPIICTFSAIFSAFKLGSGMASD